MRSLPSKHSDSSRLCRASQSVYTHYKFQSVLYAMENALACRGNWRDAPRHSLQTSQGKCIPQTPGGFECHFRLICVQDAITKSDTKLFVKQKLVVQITLTSSLRDANLDALAFVTLGYSSQVRHTPYLAVCDLIVGDNRNGASI